MKFSMQKTIEQLDLLIGVADRAKHPDVLEYREIKRQLVCLSNRMDVVKPSWYSATTEELR